MSKLNSDLCLCKGKYFIINVKYYQIHGHNLTKYTAKFELLVTISYTFVAIKWRTLSDATKKKSHQSYSNYNPKLI